MSDSSPGEARMVRVCAWCERVLGVKEASVPAGAVTHGICADCLHSHEWAADPPTLVLSRSRESLLPVLQSLLRSAEIRMVVDRRRGERRRSKDGASAGQERRGGPDRRRGVLAVVV